MIILEDVSKVYHAGTPRAFEALKSVNLKVTRGECVVLSGVSGSGKSTLLSLIAALDKPSGGKVIVAEALVSKLPDLHASAYRATHMGVVFQHFNLLEDLTVEENVIAPLIPSNLPLSQIQRMALESMQRAHIAHKASQPVRALSGGEKQRCAIARALVHDPELILCDEPTANLDKANTLKFIEMLAALHHRGKTLVVATHDPLFETLPFASRVIRMEAGTIIDSGQP